ncbi:Piwi domain-containing protein [Marinifilum sp.]|uniref:Piwi domain-containing protein n=1 Tax=Marinifilum sp. TaxID=2033137 RepID=UPI003BAB44F9
MSNIKLNFLPIIDQEFEFNIYRKEIEGAIEKNSGLKWYRLFPDSEATERKNYYVSIDKEDGFESFSCHPNHNIDLTKWYLFESLKKSVTNSNLTIEYSFYQRYKINEIQFTVNEFNEGKQLVILSPYYLRQEDKHGFLIDFKFRKAENTPFNKEVQRFSLSLDEKYRSNKNYYLDKHRLFQSFLKSNFQSIKSFNISDSVINLSDELMSVSCNHLDKKQYIFSKNRTSSSQFLGIKNYGPLNIVSDDVQFVFIFEDRFKTFANDIFLSLIGKANPGTFPGMEAMFKIKLDKTKVKRVSISDYSNPELLKAVDKVVEFSKDKKTIAVFIEDYSEEEGNSEPYYFLKYQFLKKDIPLQVLNYQKLSARNTLKWSTSNIGLQVFSKLGGKPWIVKPSNTDCLILGIGSSHKKDKETGKIQRFFAYSICLDSSGLYKKLEVLAEDEDETNYLQSLQNGLVQLLSNDDFSNYKSCVLHLPFKIKRSEIKALEQAISEVSNLDFTVVKINVDNRFFGFSNHNTLVPYESSYIQLASNQFLVWFEGLNYGKEIVDKRLSNPVHLEFLNIGTNVEDYKSYLQDIINLSGANWRGFNAKSVPISIYYSKIITEYISEFGDIVDVEQMSVTNDKPWFL